MDWPAKEIEMRDIGGLIPYARNARTHSAEQIAQLAASITEWGWTMPVLVDEAGMIIAGHGRIAAAETLGIKEVPVMVAAGWSDEKKRAYVLADNKLALNAGWDDGLLKLELSGLQEIGADISLLGFDAGELAKIFGLKKGETDPDDVPAAPAVPISKPGDIWQLGTHRIMCGDSTSATAVAALLDGAQPNLMVTDPPYGVEYDANWRNEAERKDGKAYGARAIGKVMNDGRADWKEAWALFPGDVAYVWHAGRHASTVQASLEGCGFDIRCQLVWVKQQFAIGRGDYHWMHEPCWYAVRKGKKGNWQGDRKQTTVWEINKPQKSETGHSTQKPIECMRRPIENNSAVGDSIYEPFSGSGTTIIAAEMTGRACYAMELSLEYVDMAVIRWEKFTGQKAVHIASGKTYEDLCAEENQPQK